MNRWTVGLSLVLGIAIPALSNARTVELPMKKGAVVKTNPKTVEKICDNKNKNLIQRTPLEGQVGYFVKPMVRDGKIFYTAVLNGSPSLVDSSGKVVTPLGGKQDPLVSFDHELLTVLDGNEGQFNMKFLDANSAAEGKIVPVPAQLIFFGAYQSIAPLKSEDGEKKYRMVLDKINQESIMSGGVMTTTVTTAPMIMDFKRTKDGIQTVSEFSNPCGAEWLQVPFISKNGTMLAALNLATNTTQIFDISKGGCELKHDLGFATGKADFSYDDKKVTFHLAAKPMAGDGGWVKNLGNKNSSNVFTYDLETKKINQITHNQNVNSYYPAFLPDGSIMHIDSEDIEGTKNSKYSVGRSKDVPDENELNAKPACFDFSPSVLKARFAIGELLYGICTDLKDLERGKNEAIDTGYFIMKANEVSPADCRNLVKKFWKKKSQSKLLSNQTINYDRNIVKTEIESLTKEDLLVACGGT